MKVPSSTATSLGAALASRLNSRARRRASEDHAYGIDRGTPETDDHLIDGLVEHVSSLREADQKFAMSMVEQYRRKRQLSPKQWRWVSTLTERAINGYPAPQVENVGDFTGVIALMGRAAMSLKYPKIRLQDAQGRHVVLAVAGKRAKAPGTVNVTDGLPFGQNTWYGRIDKDGSWTRSRAADDVIGSLLTSVAQDPAGTAARHGKLTGNCCFCNRALEDARSTEVGYGPVCAKNFGLPWGSGS